ncbi:hypothetical protein [Flexithrix dorotheae]|uniref:hypothetical protein n=1 Tax=Flexithrix dorotheae TaxID=70993 RepID=UPI00037CC372|nr:hypothetical protein [Flexithrix dorotheae]
MTTEELTAKIQAEIKLWQASQQGQTSGYEYEKSFVEVWAKLGREVLQNSLGDESYKKNKKKK